jgi:hypothetical protein
MKATSSTSEVALKKWQRVKDSNLRDRAQNATSWPLNEPAIFLFAHDLVRKPLPLFGIMRGNGTPCRCCPGFSTVKTSNPSW